MKRKTETSELIFRIVAYFFLIVFSIMCIYPLIYALASAFSSYEAVENSKVVLWPLIGNSSDGYSLGVSINAFSYIVKNSQFWTSYSNTLFLAVVGTIWCLIYSVLGAYALSKKRLMGRHGWNFFLVFTMWFSAGIIPTYLNYMNTADVLSAMGISDLKWTVVIAMGTNAQYMILLRNSFEGVPSEIEEAARIDGATELQVLMKVFIPMSKATIATITLFFAISRWNGYFWAQKVMESQPYSWPVQVYIRYYIDEYTYLTNKGDGLVDGSFYGNEEGISALAAVYAMVVCAVIPILIIYPFIQKYFAKGVNMGGVKE